MLSDVDIRDKIKAGEMEIMDPEGRSVIDLSTGRELEPGQLQAHGYDLRIHEIYPWGKDWIVLAPGQTYSLQPGEFVAIRTYERVRLSRNIAGTIHTMARRTLLGLGHISTTVHPGWAESEKDPQPFIVAANNVSKAPIDLTSRQRFCRLLFYEVKSTAREDAPSLSQIQRDFDHAKHELGKRYSTTTKVTGWVLLLLSIAGAWLILFLVNTYQPELANISIAVVVALLTVVIAAIRRRFNIVS